MYVGCHTAILPRIFRFAVHNFHCNQPISMCHVVFILRQFPLLFEPFYLLTQTSYLSLQCADIFVYYMPVRITVTCRTHLLNPIYYAQLKWDSLIINSGPQCGAHGHHGTCQGFLSACMFLERERKRDYNEQSVSNERLYQVSHSKISHIWSWSLPHISQAGKKKADECNFPFTIWDLKRL